MNRKAIDLRNSNDNYFIFGRMFYTAFDKCLIYISIIIGGVFFCTIITVSIKVIIKQIKNKMGSHVIIILVSDVLLISSIIDMFVFQFCRETALKFWDVSRFQIKQIFVVSSGKNVMANDNEVIQTM